MKDEAWRPDTEAEAECTCFYRLFVGGNGEKAAEAEEEVDLEEVRAACLELVKPHVAGYVWHCEGFKLHHHHQGKPVVEARARAREPDYGVGRRYLWGSTRYGDNVEDEWQVLWLLRLITSSFHKSVLLPGVRLVAQCWDSDDGDFLLIEAADELPRWVQPSTAANRVFIHRGSVVLLSHGDRNRGLGLTDALSTLMRDKNIHKKEEKTSIKVEAAVARRLRGYPERAFLSNMHTGVCQLSCRAARVLHRCPGAIAQAVDAFFTRDLQEVKKAMSMGNRKEKRQTFFFHERTFPVRVKMNRSHYAQLMQQQFEFNPNANPNANANGGSRKKNGAAPLFPSLPEKSSPAFLSAELGLKVTFGLEMFYYKMTRRKGEGKGSEENEKEKLEEMLKDSADWDAFQTRLKSLGYFDGEVEGSQRYKRLLEKSKETFLSNMNNHNHNHNNNNQSSGSGSGVWGRDSHALSDEELVAWREICKLEREEEEEEEEEEESRGEGMAMKAFQKEVEVVDLNAGDSDAWLYTGEEKLEEMMKNTTSRGDVGGAREGGRDEDGPSMEELASEMSSFVNHLSSFEGAEVPEGFSPSASASPLFDFDSAVDPSKFLDELTQAVGMDRKECERKAATSMYFSDSEESFHESSSDQEEEEEEEEEREGTKGRQRHKQRAFHCVSGSDSDDADSDDEDEDGDDTNGDLFANTYDQVLHEQLEGTKVMHTHTKGNTKVVVDVVEKNNHDHAAEWSPMDKGRVEEDVSVIENMLSSVQLQQGLPGPASNLMGMLGIQVPEEAWRPPQGQGKRIYQEGEGEEK